MVPPVTLAQYRQWAALRIAALNHALEGLPPERTRYHICWGSWNGPHMFDVPLKDIVDLVLEVKTGALSFEAANPRHEHEWRIWKEGRLPGPIQEYARARRARESRVSGRWSILMPVWPELNSRNQLA
jgi:5-methyltetrahydropteroyltriglutamate--homocysteine methyltransferase